MKKRFVKFRILTVWPRILKSDGVPTTPIVRSRPRSPPPTCVEQLEHSKTPSRQLLLTLRVRHLEGGRRSHLVLNDGSRLFCKPSVKVTMSLPDASPCQGQTNRPRNLLIQDATAPFTISFRGPFDVPMSVTVHQSPADDTWPGGALWDLGVLLAQLFIALSSQEGGATVSLSTTTLAKAPHSNPIKAKQVQHSGGGNLRSTIQLPKRLVENSSLVKRLDRPSLILELGAGVGLSGLVAAVALRGRATVMTDLAMVTEKVTRPNVERNTLPASSRTTYRTIGKNKGIAVVTPLCWGDAEDERRVLELLRELDYAKPLSSPSSGGRRKKKESETIMEPHHDPGLPDVVIIGDVAYQHKPGAPSHFEALLSTLLRVTSPRTVVVFGTRIRMPASGDLLQLFLQHFEERVKPPIRAEEVDPVFRTAKHNITIHFLQRKVNDA